MDELTLTGLDDKFEEEIFKAVEEVCFLSATFIIYNSGSLSSSPTLNQLR